MSHIYFLPEGAPTFLPLEAQQDVNEDVIGFNLDPLHDSVIVAALPAIGVTIPCQYVLAKPNPPAVDGGILYWAAATLKVLDGGQTIYGPARRLEFRLPTRYWRIDAPTDADWRKLRARLRGGEPFVHP